MAIQQIHQRAWLTKVPEFSSASADNNTPPDNGGGLAGPKFGDVIGSIGEAMQASPNPAMKAAGKVLSQIGTAASGTEGAYQAGDGPAAQEYGRLAAEMVGSAAAVAALVAYATSSLAAAAVVASVFTVAGPVVGIAAVAGVMVLAGWAGGEFAQLLFDLGIDIAEFIRNYYGSDDRGPDWYEGDGVFYNPPISPLVLDLDGDGLDVVALENSDAYFDLNEDGLAELTAWIGSDDGFLVYDLNSNGKIDDLSEMFGGQEVDGFTVLANYDVNQDGLISAEDEIFQSLQIWRDFNQDGDTDVGELFSINQGGNSIALNADVVNYSISGNPVSHESVYNIAGAYGGKIYDIWFNNSQFYTIDRNTPDLLNDSSIAFLPNLVGYGEVRSLWSAMYENPSLKQSVYSLVVDSADLAFSDLSSRIEMVILEWAGVDIEGLPSTGFIDPRHLAFLEAIHGQDFVAADGTANPGGPIAGTVLESYYQSIISSLTGKLFLQLSSSHALLLNGEGPTEFYSYTAPVPFFYDLSADRIGGDIDQFIINLKYDLDALATSGERVQEKFIESISMIKWFSSDFYESKEEFYTDVLLKIELSGLGQDAVATAREIFAAKNFYTGSESGEEINLFTLASQDMTNLFPTSANSAVFAGNGDDFIIGSFRDDTYIYSRGDDHDQIIESAYQGRFDRLLLVNISEDQISFAINGDDLTLIFAESFPGSGDGGSIYLKGNMNASDDRGIDFVEFSNGAVYSKEQIIAIANDVVYSDSLTVKYTTVDLQNKSKIQSESFYIVGIDSQTEPNHRENALYIKAYEGWPSPDDNRVYSTPIYVGMEEISMNDPLIGTQNWIL